MKPCSPLSLVMMLAAAAIASAQAPDPWVGKRVFMKYGAELTVGNDVDAKVKRPDNLAAIGKDRRSLRFYRVQRVNGELLWLKEEKSGLAGWIQSKWVVPYDQAIDFYTSLIRANPNSGNYNGRAAIWLEKGENDSAIADLNEAIRLNPSNEVAYDNRGNAWYAKKDYDRAIADYNESIRLDSKYASAYNNRGNVWTSKKDYDRAIADYGEAIRLDLNYAVAYYNRGIAWRNKKDYDRAIADYGEAIRLDPNHASAYYNRGIAWRNKKDYDRAIADYGAAIRLDPNHASAYNNRGHAQSLKKDYDRAIADYDEAIRLDPKDAQTHLNRGVAWKRKKDYDRAIADYDEVIRLDPNNRWPYNNRAWIWATCPDPKFRDSEKAVESATKACELSDWKDQNCLSALAASYAEAGDFGQAVKWEEAAIKLTPDAEGDELKRRKERLALYKEKKPYREP